jgi:hypothetical protein
MPELYVLMHLSPFSRGDVVATLLELTATLTGVDAVRHRGR